MNEYLALDSGEYSPINYSMAGCFPQRSRDGVQLNRSAGSQVLSDLSSHNDWILHCMRTYLYF